MRLTNAGRADVSIHAPARGATGSLRSYRNLQQVSIHAPARGATIVMADTHAPIGVSIHAPARGATNHSKAVCLRPARFNPRAREGRDHRPDCANGRGCPVSIHAPARGATRIWHRLRTYSAVSIHAPARGATVGASRGFCRCHRFNPRAREGRDQAPAGARLAQPQVSIHAPARGATRACHTWRPQRKVSIHAPARGATRAHAVTEPVVKFQSTRPRGARQSPCS